MKNLDLFSGFLKFLHNERGQGVKNYSNRFYKKIFLQSK